MDADKVRQTARAEMERVGTWNEALEPLLTDYVDALVRAEFARADADDIGVTENTMTGVLHQHPGHALANTEMRRAMALADELGLTPKSQLRLKVKPAVPAESDVFDRIAPKLRAV